MLLLLSADATSSQQPRNSFKHPSAQLLVVDDIPALGHPVPGVAVPVSQPVEGSAIVQAPVACVDRKGEGGGYIDS